MSGKITEEQLKRILHEEILDVTILNGEDREIHIEPSLDYNLEKNDFECCGYSVNAGGKEQSGEEREIGTFDELKKFLSSRGAGEGEYRLVGIHGGEFKSLEELNQKRKFDNITMPELLETFPTADRFSLTAMYMGGIDRKHRYGTVGISDENAEHAMRSIEKWAYDVSKNCFERIPEKERKKLPTFEALYAEIDGECKEYRKKNAAKIEKQDGNAFFCDRFAEGKCKYREPNDLWHIYSSVDFKEDCAYVINALKGFKPPVSLNERLNAYPVLKGALICTEVTFVWHCTASGMLSTVFTFTLNDSTRAWLLEHKDDYDFNDGLEDLALYEGDNILFSSCTHEHFHDRCEK